MQKSFLRILLSGLAFLYLLSAPAHSQVVTEWSAQYNGPGLSSDRASSIAVDSVGNVYVTGYSFGSTTLKDYATIKYNSAGTQLWVARYNGTGNDNDEAAAVTVDSAGNVYVTGSSYGSSSIYDYVTIKYDTDGNQLWVKRYNGPGNDDDEATAIAVDSVGNVYVTGYSWTSSTYLDFATIKYDSAGNQLWVARYDMVGYDDKAKAIAVDSSGNVYVAGDSYRLLSDFDYATVKYDSSGSEVWAQRFMGPGKSRDTVADLILDMGGNVYVTGSSYVDTINDYDYATVKYNNGGAEQWVRYYNGSSNELDEAVDIDIDTSGDIVVTGYSYSSGTAYDFATVKYNSAGSERWVSTYNGSADDDDKATSLTLDSAGNIYVTGFSYTSRYDYDYAVVKYNAAGIEEWAAQYDGPGNYFDGSTNIEVDSSGSIYVTGFSTGPAGDYDYGTIKLGYSSIPCFPGTLLKGFLFCIVSFLMVFMLLKFKVKFNSDSHTHIRTFTNLFLFLLFTIFAPDFTAFPHLSTIEAATMNPQPVKTRNYEKDSMYFIENKGQVDPGIAYYMRSRDKSFYFTDSGITYILHEQTADDNDQRDECISRNFRKCLHYGKGLLVSKSDSDSSFTLSQDRWKRGRKYALKLDFINSTQPVAPVTKEELDLIINYFKGSRDQWKTGLKTCRKLVYENLWPGIDLECSSAVDSLKYTYFVQPGADPSNIQLVYRGVTSVWINSNGELEVMTPAGGFKDEKPYAYQIINGKRSDINISYWVETSGQSDGSDESSNSYKYGFQVGDYDRNQPLIIDPAVIVFAGYVGGSGDERGLGLTVDSAGAVYVTGETTSDETTFPDGDGIGFLPGSDTTFNGWVDCYVAKVKPDGSGLEYVGYIGGSDYDAGYDITVDDHGNAYVVGATASDESTFPVTMGPDLTFNGWVDVLIAKISADGTDLIYCGYLGGDKWDFAEGVVVDNEGNAYVTGPTESHHRTFPVTVGPDLSFNGSWDAFVAKVIARPDHKVVTRNLEYCGYIGGSGDDIGVIPVGSDYFITAGHIAIDDQGSAYISGMTTSDESTFPDGHGFKSLPGMDKTHNGLWDAYVAKVRPDGRRLSYAGYIGGAADDMGFGMAVDSAGNAYLTGRTMSDETTFPVTVGPDLTYNGMWDCLLAKVNPSGTSLVFAGYIGGDNDDTGHALTIDNLNNVYVTGYVGSSETTFPVINGPDLTFNGSGFDIGDAFISKVKSVPDDPVVINNFEYSGYIGGTGDEQTFWIIVDNLYNAYVVGDTSSTESTLPVLLGPDLTSNGGWEAFVAKIKN